MIRPMRLKNGTIIDAFDMLNINRYYNISCTAEFIMENYGITDYDEAMNLAGKARDLMDKCGVAETEALEDLLAERP